MTKQEEMPERLVKEIERQDILGDAVILEPGVQAGRRKRERTYL